MQNVVQDNEKERLILEGATTATLRPATPDKCQTYADLQDKFFTVSGESDSEEGDESEVCIPIHVLVVCRRVCVGREVGY